ncbi:SH3 domain-containing protein, partial [Blautia massiliensis (ex Durand et al. 2017)]
MKRSVLMKLTACCMTGAMVLGSTGVVTMASGLDSALAGMGAEITESQQTKEVVKVAPSGYDTVAIAQVDEYVNIRDAASTESGNVVGKLYNNCKAEILGKTDDGWYLIKSGDVTGYVSSDYFVTGSQAEELAKEVGTDMATVKEGTQTLMVRSSADSNSEAISMVGDSEKLRVLEDNGDWVKVAVDDDVEGYVSKEYVDCDTEFVEAESVEQAEARKAAVQAALDKATQMQEAAYAAMNAADGNEAAYAADQANAALAEAKMLAGEQEYDYELQDLTDQIAYVAQDTSVASVWAQEAQAEEERIAAEE